MQREVIQMTAHRTESGLTHYTAVAIDGTMWEKLGTEEWQQILPLPEPVDAD